MDDPALGPPPTSGRHGPCSGGRSGRVDPRDPRSAFETASDARAALVLSLASITDDEVPPGNLGTERAVPLDDATLADFDAWMALS